MLNWYTKTFFGITVLIALAMSWYSMTDLATDFYSVPLWLSVLVSLAFDIGALFLGLVSVEYAKTNDSGLLAEAGTFAFVLASIYINVSHASLAGFGLPGMVMFGSAPVIAGIALKVYLSFVTRQARRESGRIVQRLPVTGKLTWFFYPKQTYGLLKVAMQHRLVSAASVLELPEDRHALFGDKAMPALKDKPEVIQAQVQDMPFKAPESLPEASDNTYKALPRVDETMPVNVLSRTEADIDEIVHTGDIVSLPAWLPREPTMSIAKIASKCLENNETDIRTIMKYASDIKGSPQNYSSVQKAVLRARAKAEGIV